MSRKRKNEYADTARQLKELNVPTNKETALYADGILDKEEHIVPVRTFPIMFGVPMDEVMFSKFFTFFMRNIHPMPWDSFASTESTYLPDARNTIHKIFYNSDKYSHIFMLDSDVLCPQDTVERLLSHKKPVVAGWYRNKQATKPHHPIVYDFDSDEGEIIQWTPREEEGVGLEQVGAVGAGCILMSHKVALALGEEPYDMNSGGEDMKLCYKLRKLGIPIFVDWSLDCSHLGVDWK